MLRVVQSRSILRELTDEVSRVCGRLGVEVRRDHCHSAFDHRHLANRYPQTHWRQGPDMKIEVEDKGEYQLIRCSGLLGTETRDYSDSVLHPLIEDGRSRLLVDLSGVDRITSDGISVFVTLVSRANAKGSRVVFVNPSPFVRAIFDATKITRFLETQENYEDGVKRLLSEAA